MNPANENDIMPSLLSKKQRIADLLKKIQQKKREISEANNVLQSVQDDLRTNRGKVRRVSQYQQDIERLNAVLEEVQTSVESMSIIQLNEVTKYNNPPEVIKVALEGICYMLRGKKMTWLEIRKEINKGNFIREILRFNVAKADPKVVKIVQDEYIMSNKWNLDRLQKASKAMGPLGQWLQCQVELHDASTKSKNAMEFIQIREKVGELQEAEIQTQSKIEEEEAQAEEMEEELANLREEVEEMELILSGVPDKVSVVAKRVRFAETPGDNDLIDIRAQKLSVIRNSVIQVRPKPGRDQADNYLFVQQKENPEDRLVMTDFVGFRYNKGKLARDPLSIVPANKFAASQPRKLFVDQGVERLSLIAKADIGTERPVLFVLSEKGIEKAVFADGVETAVGSDSPFVQVDQAAGKESAYVQVDQGAGRDSPFVQTDQGIFKNSALMQTDQAVGKESALLQCDQGAGRDSPFVQVDQGIFKNSALMQTDQAVGKESAFVQVDQGAGKDSPFVQTDQGILKNSALMQTDQAVGDDSAFVQVDQGILRNSALAQTDQAVGKESAFIQTDQGTEQMSNRLIDQGVYKMSARQLDQGTSRMSTRQIDQSIGSERMHPQIDQGTYRMSLKQIDQSVGRMSSFQKVEQGVGEPIEINSVDQGTGRPTVVSMTDQGTSRMTFKAHHSVGTGRISGISAAQTEASVGRDSFAQTEDVGTGRITIISTTEKGIQRMSAADFVAKKNPVEREISANLKFAQNKNQPQFSEAGTKVSRRYLGDVDQYVDAEESLGQSWGVQAENQRHVTIGKNVVFVQGKVSPSRIEMGTRISKVEPVFVEAGMDPMSETQVHEVYIQTPQGLVRHNTIAAANLFYRQHQPSMARSPAVEFGTMIQRESLFAQARQKGVSFQMQTDELEKPEKSIPNSAVFNFQQKKEIVEKNEIGVTKIESDEEDNAPDFAEVITGPDTHTADRFRRLSKAKGVHTAFAEYYLQSTADKIIQEMCKSRFLLKNYTKVTWSRSTQTDPAPVVSMGATQILNQNPLPGLMSITSQTRSPPIHNTIISDNEYSHEISKDFIDLRHDHPTIRAMGIISPVIDSLNDISAINAPPPALANSSSMNLLSPVTRQHDPGNLYGKIGLQFHNYDFSKNQRSNSPINYVVVNPQKVDAALNQTQHVFVPANTRLSRSVPKALNASQVIMPASARFENPGDQTIISSPIVSPTAIYRHGFGDNSLILKPESIQSPNESFIPKPPQSARPGFEKSNQFNLIGIQFVDKDKTKLTEHSLDDKNKIPGQPKTVVETITAPIVGFARNRETIDLKKMVAANPALNIDELNQKKFSVTYDNKRILK